MELIELSKALLTPIVAAFGAFIAWQQYKLGKQKIKLELFEKRWVILQAVRTFLGLVARDAAIDSEEVLQLRRKTFDAKFLFGEEISEYIDSIFKKGIELHTTEMMLKGMPVGDERSKLVNANTALVTWLMSQLTAMEDKFLKYFNFRKF
ncbi:MAG: hypothetical protein NTY59_12830 [Alphaproteobacteria bacterium]|nr:hypothetical protein [Alphaproteobacteria bacterium]